VNPRTAIEELRLTGSTNLKRALKRERADASEPALSHEQKSEIAQLDELIQQAMKACKVGQTHNFKRNPAYANLALLIKARKMLADGRPPEKRDDMDAANDFLAELNGKAN
jgi:predicted RNA-binding Zn ribbon-like protein